MVDEKTPEDLFKRQVNTLRATEFIKDFAANADDSFLGNIEQIIKHIHWLAMNGLLQTAGQYRKIQVEVGDISCPLPFEVPLKMEGFSKKLKGRWEEKSVVEIGAEALWGLNRVHPFENGNGRTARLFSYMLMMIKAGYVFPGTPSVPEQFGEDRRRDYVDALRVADDGDMTSLENLISDALHKQLSSII